MYNVGLNYSVAVTHRLCKSPTVMHTCISLKSSRTHDTYVYIFKYKVNSNTNTLTHSATLLLILIYASLNFFIIIIIQLDKNK